MVPRGARGENGHYWDYMNLKAELALILFPPAPARLSGHLSRRLMK